MLVQQMRVAEMEGNNAEKERFKAEADKQKNDLPNWLTQKEQSRRRRTKESRKEAEANKK
jgi:hypothetical protein